uniref:Uncharacterized protein n=1 Tax=Candidatus Kentrum sp. LFY TaxID=2126342 RepID=A0A450UYX4_9GAMM|nr:MAG: hypothetical protein BECKLFY1418A_GA0070994_10738 [Candidatus Kentron sp. LFY]
MPISEIGTCSGEDIEIGEVPNRALDAYTRAFDAAKDLHAQAEHAIATKDEALQALMDDMKMPPCATFSFAY